MNPPFERHVAQFSETLVDNGKCSQPEINRREKERERKKEYERTENKIEPNI